MKYCFVVFSFLFSMGMQAQVHTVVEKNGTKNILFKSVRILYGTASYYADKFNGRQTANGEIYDSQKMTAACNVLPLGTWIKVTNLANNRFVIVKTNDRLHARMTRIVDLSHLAAEKLGYVGRGLTKVKVEVLEKVKKRRSDRKQR